MQQFTESQLLSETPVEFAARKFHLGEKGAIVLTNGTTVICNLRTLQHVNFYLDFNRKWGVAINPAQLPDADEVTLGNKDSHRKYLDLGLETVVNATGKSYLEVSELGLDIVEAIIGHHYKQWEEYTITHNIRDYTQIYFHPVMQAAREKMKEEVALCYVAQDKADAIKRCNEVLIELANTDEFRENVIAIMLKTGTAKKDKIFQANVAIGFVTEPSADFMPEPILDCLAEGNRSYYGLAAASREACTNLLYTSAPVQETEKTNRLSFLLASSLQHFHHGEDCGSTVTYSVGFTERNVKGFCGLYRLDENNRPVLIDESTCEDLIGTVGRIRNPAGCLHPDRVGVCGICAGRIAEGFRPEWSAGHLAAIEERGPMAEIIISIKHWLKGEARHAYKLTTTFLQELLDLSDDKLTLIYRGYPAGVECIEVVLDNEKEISSLTEIFGTPDISGYDPASFTNLSSVSLRVTYDNGEEERQRLQINDGSRNGHFTMELLKWLQKHPKDLVTTAIKSRQIKTFVLPDMRLPFIRLPFRQYSMPDFNAAVKAFLDSSGELDKGAVKLKKFNKFGEAVLYFQELMSTHLDIPVAILQLTLYSLTVQDPSSENWFPAKGTNDVQFETTSRLAERRSMSSKFTGEGLAKSMGDIKTDLITDRCPSTNDAVFIGSK